MADGAPSQARSLSKRNQASASERDEILRGKKAKQASASGGEILMKEKGNQAGASEGSEIPMKDKGNQAGASEGDKILRREKENQSSALPEVGEILRRKKEMWMSFEFSEDIKIAAMRLRMAQAGSGETKKKRKTKVIQQLVSKEDIDFMMKTPHPIIGELLTDDQLAKRGKAFREAYAKCKVRSEKARAYYQALIDQYIKYGRAYDEDEVTDDEAEVTDDED